MSRSSLPPSTLPLTDKSGTGLHLSRRRLLQFSGALAAGMALDTLWPARATETADIIAIRDMKPGSFAWYPERAPQGFVAVVVNLSEQRAYVYRNGVRIGVSTVSTGRAGHDTPTGVFTILEKDVNHHSSVYNNASMPYSERLTWSGVALHAGGLPGYPSSHGCVHLPMDFAQKLFATTHVGTPVIIADAHNAPEEVLHPGLVMDDGLENLLAMSSTGDGLPDSGAQAVSMVASRADSTLTILRGAQVVLRGRIQVRDPERPFGNVVYVLNTRDGAPLWQAIAYESGSTGVQAADTLARIIVDPAINQRVSALMRPSATLLATDLPVHGGTRTGEDFVILAHKTIS